MGKLTDRATIGCLRSVFFLAIILCAGVGNAWAYQGPADPEALARGPIHEAFAGPIVYNPTPGVVVPKPPPSIQVEEQPPAEKPQGMDVEWIPGYWAWDDERADYIWISGIWRDIPPGRQWVPGYWNQVEAGFRWTSGFWTPTAANGQLNYLPAPPQSLEVGPNSPQPGPEFLWSPGSWAWFEGRYVWRPGYWVQAQPNWVWVPPSYVPTPGGYLYNDGYWDYPIARRGLSFAPVAFGPAFYAQPAYVYTPSVVLSVGGLTANLFIRPSYHQYYFGDYYGPSGLGVRSGYVPWFAYQQQRLGYDPLYASMAANHYRQPEWDRQLRAEYRYRVEHVDARPAPTFAAQRALVERRRARGEDVRGLELAHPLNQWANHPEATHRLVPVDRQRQAELARRQASGRELQMVRARMESEVRGPSNGGPRPEGHRTERLAIPRAGEVRSHSRVLAVPPSHPEPRPNGRPNLSNEHHREPGPARAQPESRRGAEHGSPHKEPRRHEGTDHPIPN